MCTGRLAAAQTIQALQRLVDHVNPKEKVGQIRMQLQEFLKSLLKACAFAGGLQCSGKESSQLKLVAKHTIIGR